jgi:transcriptional antiterminator RfaH
MSSFEIGWYIIYTKPRQEKKLFTDLEHMGIETYLPVINEKRKWQDRIKIITCPLFPSYVFVKLKNHIQFFSSSKARGFVSYVKIGKKLASVRDCVIENIELAISDANNFEVSNELFPLGKKMIIPNGTFSGLGCEIVNHRGKNKVLIRIDLLNRCILVSLSRDMLSA